MMKKGHKKNKVIYLDFNKHIYNDIFYHLAKFVGSLLIFISVNNVIFNGVSWGASAFSILAMSIGDARKKEIPYGAALSAIPILIFSNAQSFDILLIILASAVSIVIGVYAFSRINKKIVFALMLSVLVIGYSYNLFQSSKELRAIASSEPPHKSYGFDGLTLFKTYWRMENGDNYHLAMDKAFSGDNRSGMNARVLNNKRFGWRWPTVFWIWKMLTSSGDQIIILFILFSASTLVAAYLIGNKFVEGQFALIGSAALAPFWFFGGTSWWFPEPDYWSGFVLIWAIYFYIKGYRNWLPASLGLLAASIREWAVLFLVAGFITEIIRKNYKNTAWWGASGIIFGILLWLHTNSIVDYLASQGIDVIGVSRLHFFDPKVFLYHFTFGNSYYVGGYNSLAFIVIVSLLSVIWLIWKNKDYLVAVIIGIFFLAYSFLAGYPPDFAPGIGDYYAIDWIPLLLPVTGVFLGTFIRGKQNIKEKQKNNTPKTLKARKSK